MVTPDGRVEARARLIGRESLPVADDSEPSADALTPVLRFSPPDSPGASRLAAAAEFKTWTVDACGIQLSAVSAACLI